MVWWHGWPGQVPKVPRAQCLREILFFAPPTVPEAGFHRDEVLEDPITKETTDNVPRSWADLVL